MKKIHDLKTVVIDHMAINYYYTREKNDRNGNPRYRVFIIDPEAPAVYERIFTTYCVESSIVNYIENYLEGDRMLSG